MIDDSKVSAPRFAFIVWWALAVCFVASEATPAAAWTTLKVEASNGLPGFHRAKLSRHLASHMAEDGLADWCFEPAAEAGPAPNRVEWNFKLNPYAGGEVRRFARSLIDERGFHAHRPITIEARLYLNGVYQARVEKQAIIDEGGGPNDPHLVEVVASLTRSLLGPSGAYRAIDIGQHPASRSR